MLGLVDNNRTFGPSVSGINKPVDGRKRSGLLVIAALLAVATTGGIFLHQRKHKNICAFDSSIDEAFGENV